MLQPQWVWKMSTDGKYNNGQITKKPHVTILHKTIFRTFSYHPVGILELFHKGITTLKTYQTKIKGFHYSRFLSN
ncbi:hypothetical protein EUGRSUZ_F01906 [Eucalyptus grandis]|uniref:Uncharacterized protein n=2 Tax=Eucalyptus grandis TaxID=71139 RepID=A0ACC3KH90_EUCGR|nr:hypothetical protein EUGRSUZ_F01906 [Eucalyptus grandis]